MSRNVVKKVNATLLAVFKESGGIQFITDTLSFVDVVSNTAEISAGSAVVYKGDIQGYFGSRIWRTKHVDRIGIVGTVVDVSNEGSILVEYADKVSTSFPAKSLRMPTLAELSRHLRKHIRPLSMHVKHERSEESQSSGKKKRKTGRSFNSVKKAPTMDDDDIRDACWQVEGSE